MHEAYRGAQTVVTPGFAPVYLEGVSADWLDRLLSAAVVRRHEAVAVAVWPEVRASGPGLVLRFENRGPAPAAGDVVLHGDSHWAAAVSRTRYRLPGFAAETRFVPFVRWGPAPGVLSWLAEAGDRLVGRSRRIVTLPAEPRPAPVIDGLDDDWSPSGVWSLESGDAVTSPTDRIGPDDASAKVRLRLDPRGLHLFAEVLDDQFAAGSGDVFANADGLELRLDLDLAGDAGEALPGPDDYAGVAPYVDNVFQPLKVLRDRSGGNCSAARTHSPSAADRWLAWRPPAVDRGARTRWTGCAFGCDLLLRMSTRGPLPTLVQRAAEQIRPLALVCRPSRRFPWSTPRCHSPPSPRLLRSDSIRRQPQRFRSMAPGLRSWCPRPSSFAHVRPAHRHGDADDRAVMSFAARRPSA